MSIKSKKTGYAESVLYDKPESSSSLIWNEWSDSEINSEAWDHPKNGDFVDPQEVPMPSSLQPKDWKRFRELENIVSPIIFEPISDYPDLIVNNKHLLHSEFIRCFVSTLINIQYCGRNGLQIENSSTNFSWNFSEQCWQGWFHVYSLNKAGKGVTHQPVVNRNGKYIVRIFFMGSWRRVLIDDAIPIDKRGRPLLPRTANKNEMWPMILAKAMLKVAGISWNKEREIVDCNFITCLTGWIGLSLNVSHLSPRDQWEFLTKYAKHFEWPQEDKTLSESSSLKIPDKESKKQSRKSKSIAKKKLQVPEEPRPTLLFLNLEDMRDVDAEEIPGITPCWNHQIYVELSRDVPLDRAQMKPPLAKWKQHRWLDWAIRRGLIDASEYFVPIRHLLIVSPLREFNGDAMYAYDDSEDVSEEDLSILTQTTNKKNPEKTKSSTTTTFTKGKKIELPEISLWGDFNKLSLYLREVQLFYKQKFFKYSNEVSDVSHTKMSLQDRKKSKSDQLSTRDGKKSASKSFTSASPIFSKIYEYQDKTSQSRNEALYLFVDSIEEKFFLINLSTFAEDNLCENLRNNSSLIIERYDFFQESTNNESVAEIITRGSKSTVLQLEAGRHLLRIFISSESSYHVTILSDTPFHIGNRCTMHEMMITESEMIKIIVTKISNGVKKAIESFGNANYAEDLKLYHQSYMPDKHKLNNSNKRSFKSVHCYFQQEFTRLIRNRFSIDESKIIERALRIFFLDPSIGIEMNPPLHHEDSEISKIDEDSQSHKNRAATLIQSFFRMFLIKHFKEIHQPRHKEHNRVKEALEKVAELFNYDKHESVAQTLLRSTVKRDKIFESLYPCSRDFKHVIQVQELKGRVSNVSQDQWIPIVRLVINAPPAKIVFSSLDLFVNLHSYNLRVFANDTKREMIRIVNNVKPTRYKYRKGGYTVFAHGWSDFQRFKDIEWNLHLTTIKDEPMFHWMESEELIPPKNEIQSLIVQDISNTYIPNVRNLIAKVSLRIRRRSLVSLRFKTSYEKTLTRLRIVDESGITVSEFEGRGSVIIPMIFLEFENHDRQESFSREEEKPRKSKRLTHRSGGSLSQRSSQVSKRDSSEKTEKSDYSTRYFVEVYLREDSWPLTEAEWTVVAEAKTKVQVANKAKPRVSSNNAKLSKTERPKSKQFSKRSLEVKEMLLQPYWNLQIVSDVGNELEILEDRSEDEKIAELKKIWKTEESDRSARGRRLREQFLEDNSLIIARSAIDMTRMSDDEKKLMDSFESSSDQILLEAKRTLKPPADFGNYLPKLDLTIYMEKEDEEDNGWVKCEYDEETLRNQRAMNILDFEQLQSNYLDETAELMNRRRRRYERMRRIYSEKSANRVRAVEEAYEARQTYIEATKTTIKSVKSKESKQKKRT